VRIERRPQPPPTTTASSSEEASRRPAASSPAPVGAAGIGPPVEAPSLSSGRTRSNLATCVATKALWVWQASAPSPKSDDMAMAIGDGLGQGGFWLQAQRGSGVRRVGGNGGWRAFRSSSAPSGVLECRQVTQPCPSRTPHRCARLAAPLAFCGLASRVRSTSAHAAQRDNKPTGRLWILLCGQSSPSINNLAARPPASAKNTEAASCGQLSGPALRPFFSRQ